MTTDERLEGLEKEIIKLRLRIRGTGWVLSLSMISMCLSLFLVMESQWNMLLPRDSISVRRIETQELDIRDENQSIRASLGPWGGGTALHLSGKDGKGIAVLEMDKDGNPSIWLGEEKANVLLAADSGGAQLQLASVVKGNQGFVWLTAYKNGAETSLVNSFGHVITSLGATKSDPPTIIVRDATWKTRWATP